jgi:ABC-type bacteriocin/lantibiotic exporter with double-glycine peptidase domain
MSASWLQLAVLLIGQNSTVSTEELDRYVERAKKQQNACGPTAVWRCLRIMGHKVPLSELWANSAIDEDGTSLEELDRLSNSYGVSAQALASSSPNVDDLHVPAILIINDSHCIVFEGFEAEGQKIRYFEPAQGKIKTISREALMRQWSGKAIVFWRPALSRQGFTGMTILVALATVGLAATGKLLVDRGRREPVGSITQRS